jgi:hypothetical protein
MKISCSFEMFVMIWGPLLVFVFIFYEIYLNLIL